MVRRLYGVIWVMVILVASLGLSCSQEPASQDGGVEQQSETIPEKPVQESTPEPAALKSGSLVVVTYNVHGLPASITKDDTNARLKAIGPMLNQFTIAGLQEVFTDEGYKNLIEGVKHPVQHQFNKALDGKAYGAGLLLLSKFKATMNQSEYFEFCYGTLDGASDCLASKGFHMVRYTLDTGVEVDVYNSHFEAGGGEKDREAATKNLIKVRDTMLQWSKGRALIFLGDTNLKETRPSDAAALKDWIAKVGLTDSCEAVNCPMKGRIDRVFFRDGDNLKWNARSWKIPPEFVDNKGTPLSDHEPIVVTLGWNEIRP